MAVNLSIAAMIRLGVTAFVFLKVDPRVACPRRFIDMMVTLDPRFTELTKVVIRHL
jgi:hypothetical protein